MHISGFLHIWEDKNYCALSRHVMALCTLFKATIEYYKYINELASESRLICKIVPERCWMLDEDTSVG